MNKTHTILTFLTVVTFFTVLPSTFAAEFSDVPDDAWFTPYVQEAVEDGLMKGKTEDLFGSWEPMNRAELAKTLIELQHSFEQTWLEKYGFFLIFAFFNVLGWIMIGMIVYNFSQKPIIIEQKAMPVQKEPTNIEKKSQLIAENPEPEPPLKLENDFQEDENKKDIKKTNWWI